MADIMPNFVTTDPAPLLPTLLDASGSPTTRYSEALRDLRAHTSGLVSVKDYGAVGDGSTDDTAAIQAAINAGAGCAYLPAGTYYIAGTLLIPSGGGLSGAGVDSVKLINGTRNTTIIKAANAGTNRTSGVTILDLSVFSNAAATATVMDLRGVSYLKMRDVRAWGDRTVASQAKKIIDLTSGATGAAVWSGATTYAAGDTVTGPDGLGYVSLQGANLNHAPPGAGGDAWWRNLWCGYNRLDGVMTRWGTVGLHAQVNQLFIRGGIYSDNNRGIWLQGTYDAMLTGSDLSGNGSAGLATWNVDRYDKGGLLVENSIGIEIEGLWHEQNARRESASLYIPNDVEILSDCKRVRYRAGRVDIPAPGVAYGRASTLGVEYASGRGFQHGSDAGLVPNGRFSLLDGSGNPLGWTITNTFTSITAASVLPTGVAGKRFAANASFPRIWRQVLTAAQCAALAGKTLTATFYANAVSSPWPSGYLRAGLSTDAGGAMSNGSFFVVSDLPAVPQHFAAKYKITGSEANGVSLVFVTDASAGSAREFEVGDVSVTLSEFEPFAPEQVMTSAGGEVYGPLSLPALATYADNAAATAGGVAVGHLYRTSAGVLMVRV